jgi:hypothetical protein
VSVVVGVVAVIVAVIIIVNLVITIITITIKMNIMITMTLPFLHKQSHRSFACLSVCRPPNFCATICQGNAVLRLQWLREGEGGGIGAGAASAAAETTSFS